MDGQTTRTEAEEALVMARRNAERLLDEARSTIAAIFDHVAETAEEVEAAAKADAEIRLADAGAESDKIVGAARQDARRILERAQAEARDLLAGAQAEHQRLRQRLPEISAALAAFEDRLTSFYDSETIDLTELERAAGQVEAAAAVDETVDDEPHASPEPEPVAQHDEATEDVAADEPSPEPGVDFPLPVPDGSGKPLASRATIAPTDLADVRLADHLASRSDDGEEEMRQTIYQRRGGGLKRRIREQQD